MDDTLQCTLTQDSEVVMKNSDPTEQDIYRMLAGKERDLILAAELGKALLLKNEELSRKNEQMAEEYSFKLEDLEQENYQLRRRLEVAEEEYEIRIQELQTDLTNLRDAIGQHSSSHKFVERDKNQTINDLMEQNQRLISDLREVEERETNVKQEIQRLQSQFNQRRTRMQAHFNQVESVRDEIDLVMNQKFELERQIQSLLLERDELTSSLEYSSQTIQDLERRQREQEALIRRGERESEELKNSNLYLQDKLEALARNGSLSPYARLSLQSELDMSGTGSEKSLRKQFEAINELEEYEFDGDDNLQFQDEGSWVDALSEEILSAYSQLKNMCILIREREKDRIPAVYSDSLEHSPHSDSVQSLQVGQLKCIVIEIKSLLHDIFRMESRDVCTACTGEDVRLRLEQELHSAELQVERKTKELQVSQTTQRTQKGELLDLRSKLTLLEARLKAVNEEREALKCDLINLTQTREQIILRSWETRDGAVNRKNAAELELVKARTDLTQASEQLLEAVQQKVQIAEQLDQWESDIHTVIEARLEESRISSAKPCHGSVQRTLSNHTNNKIISLFQRS